MTKKRVANVADPPRGMIEIELERVEGRLSKGEDADLDAFARASSHLRRILESLGIERRSRDITPSLSTYISSRAAEKARAAE